MNTTHRVLTPAEATDMIEYIGVQNRRRLYSIADTYRREHTYKLGRPCNCATCRTLNEYDVEYVKPKEAERGD